VEYTGFCVACSPPDICHHCGQYFIKDQPSRTTCESCKAKLWVEKYADAIEEVMAEGKSYNQAYRIVRAQKHSCLICGDQLRKGGEFCRKRPECKKVHRRVIYLTNDKGLDKETALKQAIGEYVNSRTEQAA
jgi:hypothetical protein